ncbi:MAG TPA: hypothetical protein VHS05_14590 [Pyrinomonadaceae bacterium]|jgi:hypothetical protein|nr:hypothetical protein [Pyrinomonadaceae bacterium]
MKFRVSLCALLMLTATTWVCGQGAKVQRTPEDYLPRTMRQLTVIQPPSIAAALAERNEKEVPDIIVHSDSLPSRVKVLYGGSTRPLNETKKSVILSWAHQFAGLVEFYTVPYQTEALFTENGENYWVAMRQEFLPKFEQEFKEGDAIELFLIKIGSVKKENENKLEPVLLIEQYLKR